MQFDPRYPAYAPPMSSHPATLPCRPGSLPALPAGTAAEYAPRGGVFEGESLTTPSAAVDDGFPCGWWSAQYSEVPYRGGSLQVPVFPTSAKVPFAPASVGPLGEYVGLGPGQTGSAPPAMRQGVPAAAFIGRAPGVFYTEAMSCGAPNAATARTPRTPRGGTLDGASVGEPVCSYGEPDPVRVLAPDTALPVPYLHRPYDAVPYTPLTNPPIVRTRGAEEASQITQVTGFGSPDGLY
jgi:hypothetical protein